VADYRNKAVLVVGASSGIGKAVAADLAERGALVIGAARRVDLIETAPAVVCDVRDAASCRAAVDDAVSALGGLDGLVYAAGAAPLRPLVATSEDEWLDLLRTNLVGAALITVAALEALSARSGSAVYLSSHSVPDPWPGLGAYAASKAGLETMVRGWATEHPTVTWASYSVGPTLTGFADGWDPDVVADVMTRWSELGLLSADDLRKPAETAADIVKLLGAPW
jgi:NAD(P)-dependent dehydrogenase (short-subunit alcohol dehydrogenase family)